MKEKFKSTAEIENSMKKLEDGIYKIQRGFAGIGIGFSIFKSIPINEARSFEKELGLLQAVSGATAKEFKVPLVIKKLRNKLKKQKNL